MTYLSQKETSIRRRSKLRIKINTQPEFNFQPSKLKLTKQYYQKYEIISKVLDDNRQVVDLIHRDLKNALKSVNSQSEDSTRFVYTSDTILRILLCQVIEGESLRGIVIRIDDSNYLRRFVRIYNGPMLDFTTLCKLKNSIHPDTWEKVNKALAQYAVRNEMISGEALRLDTTAVETNIHWPTDSSLLWDVYRVLARLIEQVRDIDPQAVGNRRLHRRRVKRLHAKIARKATKNPGATAKLKPLYGRLIEHVEAICDWSASVGNWLKKGKKPKGKSPFQRAWATALIEELENYRTLGMHVVDQAWRRVICGEQVPNEEKLFSIFEPHTELLKRGKAGKPIEFGHMIQIQQVQEKFITDYTVFKSKPVEHQLLKPVLESHKKLFGEYPKRLSADKGYYESMDTIQQLSEKVETVSIAKKGRRTEEEDQREADPVFRHAQRFRAGIEGTISFMKRVLGLFRAFSKGWKHFVSTVATTIFAHNLLILARC